MEEKTLIITDGMVRKHLTTDDVIGRVEDTWRWYGEGRIIMPVKVTTDMQPAGVAGWFNSMPSYIGPSDMAGLKLVGGYADNPRHGLPYIRANLMLIDPRNGALRALMVGDWISDMRTGSQPAVAALVGMGCLDLSVAALAYERIVAARERVPAIDMMS